MTDAKMGDRVRVTFNGQQGIFRDGDEASMMVVGMNPLVVGWYPIGPQTDVVFGEGCLHNIEKT